jgi:CheY-like chemotaxis protein
VRRKVEVDRMRVLLVEDNIGDAKLIGILFETSTVPITIEHVCDGEKALIYLGSVSKERTPDLILLDLKMPRMDGFDFLRVRLRDSSLAAIPTIVLTGSDAMNDKELAMRLGADMYLIKPSCMDEAETLVPSLLSFMNSRSLGYVDGRSEPDGSMG